MYAYMYVSCVFLYTFIVPDVTCSACMMLPACVFSGMTKGKSRRVYEAYTSALLYFTEESQDKSQTGQDPE